MIVAWVYEAHINDNFTNHQLNNINLFQFSNSVFSQYIVYVFTLTTVLSEVLHVLTGLY